MTARTDLVEAAATLIWDRGVEATSPNALLAAAGVGQGSLYHHFRNKQDWAHAAIAALAAGLTTETDAVLADRRVPGRQRIEHYLSRSRNALAGCRLGRLAFDPAVVSSDVLQAPIRDYFTRLRRQLSIAIADAVTDGDLSVGTDADGLADAIAAVVQGGYVLSRATDDDTVMSAATSAVRALLTSGAER